MSVFPRRDVNINLLEFVPVFLGVKRLKDKLPNQHVVCYNDNTQVQACVNKGISSNKSVVTLLRHLFWELVEINCFITVRHIPGDQNSCANMLSRIDNNWSIDALNKFQLCCRNPSGY